MKKLSALLIVSLIMFIYVSCSEEPLDEPQSSSELLSSQESSEESSSEKSSSKASSSSSKASSSEMESSSSEPESSSEESSSDESMPEPEPPATPDPEPAPAVETVATPDPEPAPESVAPAANGAFSLRNYFVPSNGNVVYDNEGLLLVEVNDSLQNVIDFCQNSLYNLGAFYELDTSQWGLDVDGWLWGGYFDDNGTRVDINIVITADDEKAGIYNITAMTVD